MKNQKQLRCGITTGTCATAAAKAAAAKLLLGIRQKEIIVHTPGGVTVTVPVRLTAETEYSVSYTVIKDSGDDPDVTDQAEICVCVERLFMPEREHGEEGSGSGEAQYLRTRDIRIYF